jgi:hypothetical protein
LTAVLTSTPSKARLPWTQEDYATLKRMLSEGATRKQIGDALGRSPDAVNTKCCETGVFLRKNRDQRNSLENFPTDLNENVVWIRKCAESNERFRQAMEANPTERPSDIPEERQGYVRQVGRISPRSSAPSWSSMGDCV